MKLSASVPTILLEARKRAALSQRELAEKAATAQSVVARIEGGQSVPNLETLERLAAAAGFELRLVLSPATPSDPLIDAYKRDIDRTLLRENLTKSVDERVTALAALARFAEEAQRAGRAASRDE